MRTRLLTPVAALAAVGVLLPAAAAVASPSGVVISQLRTRSATSQYDEFVQLTNTTAAPVDLSGYQLYDCYTSGGRVLVGTDSNPLPSGTRLPAGGTFVLGKDAGDYTGVADATYHYLVTETGGFQLRDGAGTVQDAVGAPGSACAEGTGLTFPTTGSDFDFTRRSAAGVLQDSDDNAADFDGPSGDANPPACGAACAPPPSPTAIDAIQGSGATSPLVGQKVQITGVVTGVDNQQGVSNYVDLDPRQAGIYVETPTSRQDSSTATSEGIFVGGLTLPDRTKTHIGQTVTVSGTVNELYGLTMLDATGQTPAFSGTPGTKSLPAPVVIDPEAAHAQSEASDGTRSYYETLEGMRVTLPVGTANSGGTDKFGELYLQPGTTRRRVFSDNSGDDGPADLLDVSQDGGSADVDPTNPDETPASTTRVRADLFDRVSAVTGPVGFDFGDYQIVPQPGSPRPVVTKGQTTYPPAAPAPSPGTLRVSEFNMENLFGAGMVDDGHTYTQAEVDAKTTRLANAIKLLKRPQILSVEEVASKAALQEVADKVGGYQVIWRASNDARHVAVGFLVRQGVTVTAIKQLGANATTTATGCNDDGSANPQLFERPPLELDVTVGGLSFAVIGNHWASQGHPEACRDAQGDFLAGKVAAIEGSGGNAIVLGDLNDFPGAPALATDLVAGTSLRDLWSKAPASDRYSYAYDGQLETLDHIFVTKRLASRVRQMEYVHFDNDYYERNETTSPTKVSDHDPPVVSLTLPPKR